MQPAREAVCVNMQPYDGYEKSAPVAPRNPAVQQHRDFVLWSLFNFGFLNCCCLGFAALVFSIKSRDRKVLGDPDGAARYGQKAKCLNITALIVSLILTIIFIIVYSYVIANLVQQVQATMNRQH